MSDKRTYNSALRQEQSDATREKILQSMAAIYAEEGRIEAATTRAVAARAGVREVTVYRHFPSRDVLLQGLWAWLNRRNGVTVGMPETADEIALKVGPLYQTFDAAPGHVLASVRTEEGLKIRSSLNAERSAIFLKLVAEAAPALDEGERVKAAALLQLLYSAYPWISFREQWDLTGEPAAEVSAWAVEIILAELRRRGAKPLRPTHATATAKDAAQ
ncbi:MULTISPECIES: TetR family transcriptional regulator [unclassified Phenylobacterium]|uniref:TetR family transcriptional regulator n=1 Tax=unclassified Phenylobacterium TaxID=2640670 RepID=UPI00083A4849|nr:MULTISPECIES: TetR/AcrR family transcriptional regulator [unclassified Phenylobacterium]